MRFISVLTMLILGGCNIFNPGTMVDPSTDAAIDLYVPDVSDDSAVITTDTGFDASIDIAPDQEVNNTVLFELAGETEFEAGDDFDNVEWGVGGLQIASLVGAAFTTATYVSRVFDAQGATDWQTIEWAPERPYFFTYPDDGRSETTYTKGNFDSENLVLMSHFNAPVGTLMDGGVIADNSEHARSMSVAGEVQIANGPVGSALNLGGAGYLQTDAGDVAFSPEANDFTWSTFVLGGPCPTTLAPIMALDELNAFNRAIFLGCLPPALGCSSADMMGRYGAAIASGAGPLYFACDDAIPSTNWVHLALVKRATTLSLFVDGVRKGQIAIANEPYSFDPATLLKMGHLDSLNTTAAGVQIDEATFFHRALDDFEIEDQVLRFWLGAIISVRTCDNAVCTDVPPWDEDPDVMLVQDSAAGPTHDLSALPARRYLQFRVQFTSLSNDETPRFAHVRIHGERRSE